MGRSYIVAGVAQNTYKIEPGHIRKTKFRERYRYGSVCPVITYKYESFGEEVQSGNDDIYRFLMYNCRRCWYEGKNVIFRFACLL